jgi:acyl-CoA hydrolase
VRPFLILIVLLLGLAAASSADAAVGLISVTSPVHPGGTVTLVARAASTTTCSIRVHFGSRPSIITSGQTRRPVFTVLRWTWTMPAHATHGRWTIDVSCGAVGTLHTSFLVR